MPNNARDKWTFDIKVNDVCQKIPKNALNTPENKNRFMCLNTSALHAFLSYFEAILQQE